MTLCIEELQAFNSALREARYEFRRWRYDYFTTTLQEMKENF